MAKVQRVSLSGRAQPEMGQVYYSSFPSRLWNQFCFGLFYVTVKKNHDKHNLWEERGLFHYFKITIFHREQVAKYQISHLSNSQIATPKDWRGDIRPQDVSISKNE